MAKNILLLLVSLWSWRCTFTATWWRGSQTLWMKIRKPAIMTRKLAGEDEYTFSLLKFITTLCWRWPSVAAPVAGGSCLMIPVRIPFVAVATRPASLAPGEEWILVFLVCSADINILFFSLVFIHFLRFSVSLMSFSPPCLRRIPGIQPQICFGTTDHCGSGWVNGFNIIQFNSMKPLLWSETLCFQHCTQDFILFYFFFGLARKS